MPLPRYLLCTLLLPACGTFAPDDDDVGGKADSFDSDQVVVNEIAANPDVDVNGDGKVGTGDEYIEIVNGGASDIDLSGVEIADGNSTRFTFPDDAVLPGGHVALIMADPGKFAAPSGAKVFDAGRLGLNNDSDSITVRNGDTVLEKHGYSMADGERRAWNRTTDANHDTIFELTTPTPGTRRDGSLYGTSILSDEEAKSVLSELDNECPDTFCGGDFSYFFVDGAGSLECLGNGTCTMGLRAKPAVDDKFPRTVLDGVSASDLLAFDPRGHFDGRVTTSVVVDTFGNDQDVFVNATCLLRGDYYRAADIVRDNGRPTADFRDAVLDCINGDDGLERNVLGHLSTFNGLLTEFERDNLLLALHEECPDTFCGGDFTYFFTNGDGALHCENDGTCALSFTVTPFDDAWADDPTSGLSPTQLSSTSASGLFEVTATGSKVVNGETVVELRCDLFAPTFEAEEIYDRAGDEATSEFRDQFLACLSDADGAEATVLGRLPLR